MSLLYHTEKIDALSEERRPCAAAFYAIGMSGLRGTQGPGQRFTLRFAARRRCS